MYEGEEGEEPEDFDALDEEDEDDKVGNNLAAGVDWDDNAKAKGGAKGDNKKAPAGDDDKPPSSPFRRTPVEEKPLPADKPSASVEAKKPETGATQLPKEALDANTRAMRALAQVEEGKPLSVSVKADLEAALRDASKIDDKYVAEQEKKMEESLRGAERKLPNGTVLPPWTKEKEEAFWANLTTLQKAAAALPEETAARIASLEAELKATPFSDSVRRGRILNTLREEGDSKNDPSGKVSAYYKAQAAMEKFTRENAAGIARRTLHMQEVSVLHSKALVSAVYAVALEKSGSTDTNKIATLVKTAAADKFVLNTIPDVARLQEKYKIQEKDPLDDKVAGRVSLKKALEIMSDERQGTMKERLEKAKPFFEEAIAASDKIDTKKAEERLKELAKEAAELGEGGDPKRLAELDEEATLLIEAFKQPGLSRMAYGMALHNTGVESKDAGLRQRALEMFKSIEKVDPSAKYDEFVQGAIKMASAETPVAMTEQNAVQNGTAEVAKRKEEDVKAGKKEDDTPMWQKILRQGGEFLVGMAAWYALSKVFRSIRQGPMRAWQTARRVNSVTTETSADMKPGEAPKLVIKDADGKFKEVTGVRKEDGTFRVKDGDKTELVKMGKGEKLVVLTHPDNKLTAEQAKEAAAKVLTPTRTEEEVAKQKQQHEEKLRLNELEMQQMRDANAELQKQLAEARTKEVLMEMYKQVTDPTQRAAYERLVKSPQGGPDLVAEILKLPAEARKDSGLDAAMAKDTRGSVHEIREAYRRAHALNQIDTKAPPEMRAELRKLVATTEGLGQTQRILNLPPDILKDSKIGEALTTKKPGALMAALRSAEEKFIEVKAKEMAPIPALDKVLTPEQVKVAKWVGEQQTALEEKVGVAKELPSEVLKQKVDAYMRGEGHAAKSLPPGGTVRADKVIHIVMGLPGAGKTSAITEPLAARYGARLIDSDMIKPDLPGYRGGMGNQLLHTPSGQIADAVLAEGLARGENLVYSTIGRTPDSVYATIEQARAQGYRVAVHLADVSPQESAKRVYERGYQGDLTNLKEGSPGTRQLMPPDYSLNKAGHRPRITFDMIVGTPGLVDAWQIIDTNATTAEGKVIPKPIGASSFEALENHVPPTADHGTGPASPPPAPESNGWKKVGEMSTGKETVLFKRGAKPAGDINVRDLDPTFNPDKPGEKWVELKFEGRPDGVRYFADPHTREVFVYSENNIAEGLSTKTMTRTYDVEIMSKAQAEARMGPTTTGEGSTRLPVELVRATAGGAPTGQVEMLELDALTGRLKRVRVGLSGDIPKIGELNEKTIEGLVKGWERDIDKELERLKGDKTREAEYNELLKQKEAMVGVRTELAAGGDRARKVVEHFQRSIEPGAEIPRFAEGGRWRGRVMVGGGVIIGVGILVGAAIGFHNRLNPGEKPKHQGPSSLPKLGK